MDKIADVAAAIVTVALVTTLVSHRRTAEQVNAVGVAFSRSINAALGRGYK